MTSTVQQTKPPALAGLLQSRQLIVCLGTGGVGKTTTSALLALAGAYVGRKAVVLTIDPARRLADALGVGTLGSEPREVDPTRLWPGSKGTLHALMLNPAETFDRLVARMVKDEARRDRMLQHPVYQQMSRGLAGVHEYMAVEKLHDLAHDPRFDLVVLDTPPSKNALDFLEAPNRASKFFNEKITRFFVPKEGKPSITDRFFHAAQDAAMGLIGKVVGEDFMKDLADFMASFQGLFTAFEERGLFVEKYLRGEKCAYVIVTAPDPVRVEEGLEFAARLRDFKLRPSAFVVNRVRLTPAGGVPTPEQALQVLAEHNVDATRRADLAAALSRHQQERAALSDRDARTVAELHRRADGAEVLVAPDVLESPNDPEALAGVCRALLGFP
ncbi:MAG: ArsA-related P-loop ATPase [Myxococcota bacterium]